MRKVVFTRSPANQVAAIALGACLLLAGCMSRSGFESLGRVLDADPCLAAEEICGNRADDDCDGLVDEGCATACGSLAGFRDDFDDPARGLGWEPRAAGGIATEADGFLTLQAPAGSGEVSYFSSEALALQGGRVSVEILGMVDTSTSASFLLSVVRNGVGYVNLRQTQGVLTVEQGTLAGDYTAIASLPYEPGPHRWWRLTFDDENGAAEVSADGVAWTSLATFSLPFPADLVHVGLIARGSEAPSAGQARVDNFNGSGAGGLSNCPIDGLADDFDDGVIGPLWDRSFTSGGAVLTEVAGDVVLTPAPGVAGAAGLYSSNRYDLRERSITARVTQVLAPSTSTESVLRLISGANEAFFLVRNNRLIALVAQNGSNVLTDVPYSASLHRCWRFRESAGTLTWETAGGTCTAFSTLASMAITFDTSSVSVILFAQSFAGVAAPGSMHVDSLTVP